LLHLPFELGGVAALRERAHHGQPSLDDARQLLLGERLVEEARVHAHGVLVAVDSQELLQGVPEPELEGPRPSLSSRPEDEHGLHGAVGIVLHDLSHDPQAQLLDTGLGANQKLRQPAEHHRPCEEHVLL